MEEREGRVRGDEERKRGGEVKRGMRIGQVKWM